MGVKHGMDLYGLAFEHIETAMEFVKSFFSVVWINACITQVAVREHLDRFPHQIVPDTMIATNACHPAEAQDVDAKAVHGSYR